MDADLIKEICGLWASKIVEAKESKKQLALIYLVHDILQRGRREQGESYLTF